MFMIITNKELDARIDYACRNAVKKAMEDKVRKEKEDIITSTFLSINRTSIFKPKSALEVLKDQVKTMDEEIKILKNHIQMQAKVDEGERIERVRQSHNARIQAFDNACKRMEDSKLPCGTPIIYLRGGPVVTRATLQQYLDDGETCVIEVCSSSVLLKVPTSSIRPLKNREGK